MNTDREITYTPSKRTPGMYVARDARGKVCGYVSRKSVEADCRYRGVPAPWERELQPDLFAEADA